jgi:hypothetical protein
MSRKTTEAEPERPAAAGKPAPRTGARRRSVRADASRHLHSRGVGARDFKAALDLRSTAARFRAWTLRFELGARAMRLRNSPAFFRLTETG